MANGIRWVALDNFFIVFGLSAMVSGEFRACGHFWRQISYTRKLTAILHWPMAILASRCVHAFPLRIFIFRGKYHTRVAIRQFYNREWYSRGRVWHVKSAWCDAPLRMSTNTRDRRTLVKRRSPFYAIIWNFYPLHLPLTTLHRVLNIAGSRIDSRFLRAPSAFFTVSPHCDYIADYISDHSSKICEDSVTISLPQIHERCDYISTIFFRRVVSVFPTRRRSTPSCRH